MKHSLKPRFVNFKDHLIESAPAWFKVARDLMDNNLYSSGLYSAFFNMLQGHLLSELAKTIHTQHHSYGRFEDSFISPSLYHIPASYIVMPGGILNRGDA